MFSLYVYCFVSDITDLDRLLTVLEKSNFPDNKWDELGLKLGITKPVLDTIREDKQDSNARLKECLSRWLHQNYDTDQYYKPTVESLVAALRRMGLRAVASIVTQNLTKIPAQHGQFLLLYCCFIYYFMQCHQRTRKRKLILLNQMLTNILKDYAQHFLCL